MKSELINLIKKYNNLENGLHIQGNIAEYVDKILKRATIISYNDSGLKAFIAFYCNDNAKLDAYLSLIIVDAELKGNGIGRLLINNSLYVLNQKGFKNYGLEVLKNNEGALSLYESLGFEIVGEKDLFFKMNKKL